MRFVVDSTSYEIGLNAKNAAFWRKLLTPYTEHALQVGDAGPPGRTHGGQPTTLG